MKEALYIDAFKNTGLSVSKLKDYYSGDLSKREDSKVEALIYSVEKESNPNISDFEIDNLIETQTK